ncbi:16S rRNA (cytosine(1402)-N(4))-methyltransferase RsmH [Facilibium subflavum]|uniref:16S rRNA (cytosine(1402)-N(4))-methyltransferase RsmH n=1 Tax=Facilibium subflavum TaxID=2219058 RepID=UPI000E65C2ED|nr:16S rRNA (cytosine(1402)-N(4))-methyltransferase RsmH [Facilibium subflavum]
MHYSVLLDESIDALSVKSDGIYIDGTFGRGGHTKALLKKLSDKGRLIAFDRDPNAVNYAKSHFTQDNFSIIHAPFSSMKDYCQRHGLLGKIDGVLLDLGVSSPQLDEAVRGFSFSKEGPLDMRMDPTQGIPASEVLITHDEQALADIFRTYGEEKHAWKIACAIKKHLDDGQTLTSTTELADLIYQSIGKREKKHPATRCFQALRIYVNQELEELKKALGDMLEILAPKGRLSIISFHSLEDRIVKRFMVGNIQGEQKNLPRHLPLVNTFKPKFKWIIKKAKADSNELDENIRSRSAILRAVEKIA